MLLRINYSGYRIIGIRPLSVSRPDISRISNYAVYRKRGLAPATITRKSSNAVVTYQHARPPHGHFCRDPSCFVIADVPQNLLSASFVRRAVWLSFDIQKNNLIVLRSVSKIKNNPQLSAWICLQIKWFFGWIYFSFRLKRFAIHGWLWSSLELCDFQFLLFYK